MSTLVSAELLQSRYKISAGECRISAQGGPVLRYLVDLSRLRLAYSVSGLVPINTHTPPAALSLGQRPQPSSQCGAVCSVACQRPSRVIPRLTL